MLLTALLACAHTPELATTETGYDRELRTLDERIERERDLSGWKALERIAQLQIERARLTGDYDDYAAAEGTLAQAFELAPAGSGPLLTRARLHYTLHRMPEARADVAQVKARPLMTPAERRGVADLEAAIAFQSGAYGAALAGCSAAEGSSYAADAQLAVYHWKTGDFDAAHELLAAAEAGYHGRAALPRAWVHLQRGLMDLDRGRLDDALAHYRDADAELDGWWLIDEHVAEVYALQGRLELARDAYEDVVARTGSPELMGALAGVCGELGDTRCERQLVGAATDAYQARMQRYPEAVGGHALDHYLEHGSAERALGLAERNHVLRPGGESLVVLAQAYLAAGRVEQAAEAIAEVEDSPWRTMDYYEVAAAVAEAQGFEVLAAKQRVLGAALAGG